MQGSNWTSNVWGSKATHGERLVLVKGEETCHICMESNVEVSMNPCRHQICLECCNRLRAANIFKVDAGIRCPLCRDYVELFTDLQGNPSSVPSLRAANEAAAKSLAARNAGQDQAVSTSVPDPTRLIPAATSRPEPQWVCPKCQHVNTGNKENCVKCRTPNSSSAKASVQYAGAIDPLTCPEDAITSVITEKGVYSLKKSLVDAGTPVNESHCTGTVGSVREALQKRGHERVMRVIHYLCAAPTSRLIPSCNSQMGTFGIQRLLESAAKLRAQAVLMAREGIRLNEDFASLPPSVSITAATAFPKLLSILAAHTVPLVKDQFGVHVLLLAVTLASSQEVLQFGHQVAVQFHNFSPPGQISKETSMYMCHVVTRLCNICYEGTPAALQAADCLNTLLQNYRHHVKIMNMHSRHPYLGPAITEAAQGALPRVDAFRVCHMLATNAYWVTGSKGGVQTMSQLFGLLSDDPLSRKMLRDIACAAALNLRRNLVDLACQARYEGPALVKQLLDVLSKEREDDWVKILVKDLLDHAERLDSGEESFAVLMHGLSLPQINSHALVRHLKNLDAVGIDADYVRQTVEELQAVAEPLEEPYFDEKSEYQPDKTVEFAKKRLPMYVWEMMEQERHGKPSGAAAVLTVPKTPAAMAARRAALERAGAPAALVMEPEQLPLAEENYAAGGESNVAVAEGWDYMNGQTAVAQQQQYNEASLLQQQYDAAARTSLDAGNGWGWGSEFPSVGGVEEHAYSNTSPATMHVPGSSFFSSTDQVLSSNGNAVHAGNDIDYSGAALPSFLTSSFDPMSSMFPMPTSTDSTETRTSLSAFTAQQQQQTWQQTSPPQQQQQQQQHHTSQQFTASGEPDPASFFPQFAQTTAPMSAYPLTQEPEFATINDMLNSLSTNDTATTTPVRQAPKPYRPPTVTSPTGSRIGAVGASGVSLLPSDLWSAPEPQVNNVYSSGQYNSSYGAAATTTASPPAQAAAAPSHWTCGLCTYMHTGKEADFLVCAICGSQRPS